MVGSVLRRAFLKTVLWDGTKKVQQFHKDFIEVAETHDQEKE
jgi:hypothetical protein